ncbi:MAG: hypothetical protein Q4E86_06335 [Lachnospiraceae bacterium]|nr:hypothetical protein [Lachnospiraceae bacterium]
MTRFPIVNWWISRKMDHLHLILAICGSLACLLGVFGNFPVLSVWGTRSLTVLAVVHLVHYHLHCFWRYLQDYQECDRLPVQQMKQSNALLMGVFLLAFCVCLVIGWHLPWKAAGSFLGNLILTGIRWLVRLLPHSENQLVPEISQGAGSYGMPDLPASAASPIALILERVISVILLAAAILLSLRLFLRGLQKLVEYMGSVHFAEDEMVFLKPESIRERQKGKEKKFFWSRYFPRFDHTREGRIRRMYWQCIQERMNQRPNGQVFQGRQKQTDQTQRSISPPMSSMTPYQLEQAAGIWKSEGAAAPSRFHHLYEKARYSQEGCSKEEEQQMKESSCIFAKKRL